MEIILSILILVSAGLAIYGSQAGLTRLRYIFKPLTTALTLVLALSAWRVNPPYYRSLVAIGLFFSLVGDVFLMLPNKFEYGLSSFLVTLILYSIAFTIHTELALLWLLPLILYMIFMSALLWPKLGHLRIPVLIYEMAMIAMAWRALARLVTFSTTINLLAAVGALLFLASDSLLAIDHFRVRLRWAHLFILSMYYVGQWLIALSV
ncbi:MAG: lysoplasmalogenase [Anaerolineae bacterium]